MVLRRKTSRFIFLAKKYLFCYPAKKISGEHQNFKRLRSLNANKTMISVQEQTRKVEATWKQPF